MAHEVSQPIKQRSLALEDLSRNLMVELDVLTEHLNRHCASVARRESVGQNWLRFANTTVVRARG